MTYDFINLDLMEIMWIPYDSLTIHYQTGWLLVANFSAEVWSGLVGPRHFDEVILDVWSGSSGSALLLGSNLDFAIHARIEHRVVVRTDSHQHPKSLTSRT